MAINGISYNSPENKRWAEVGVERKLEELEKLIVQLRAEIEILKKRR